MRFDDLPEDEALELLLRCLSAPEWAERVLALRPYGTVADLLGAADRAMDELSADDLEEALGGHPRIGERAAAGHNEEASAREQAGVAATSSADVKRRLAEGNLAYEEKFDQVFLIRAAGRSAEEILAELERRLRSSHATEHREMVDNLRQIALLRLESEA